MYTMLEIRRHELTSAIFWSVCTILWAFWLTASNFVGNMQDLLDCLVRLQGFTYTHYSSCIPNMCTRKRRTNLYEKIRLYCSVLEITLILRSSTKKHILDSGLFFLATDYKYIPTQQLLFRFTWRYFAFPLCSAVSDLIVTSSSSKPYVCFYFSMSFWPGETR